MAYLSRCFNARSIPALSKIIGSSLPCTAKGNLLSTILRPYSSTCLTRNVTRIAIKNINSTKKLPNSLNITNQIRSSSSGDHVKLWQLERIASAAFVVLLPAVLLQNPIIDVLFSALLVMHTHWGLEAIIVDYARPRVVGPILPKVLHATLYLLSALTLGGLLALVYNGPGVGGAVKKIWALDNKN